MVCLGLSVFIAAAFSQNISGVVTGTVKDPAGSVIPGAKVTLTNQATGAAQSLDSNEAGLFVFSSVLPGTYTVEVSASGFSTYQARDVAVTMNERRTLGDVVL